jgi:hypothetical protein
MRIAKGLDFGVAVRAFPALAARPTASATTARGNKSFLIVVLLPMVETP